MKPHLNYVAIPFVALAVFAAHSAQPLAGGKEKFTGRAVLNSVSDAKIDVPDSPGHGLYQGVMDGVIFNETGGSFLADARYQVFWMGDIGGASDKVEGYKVFTMADDVKVVAKFEGQPSSASSDGKGHGTWTLVNGTGQYEGVKGGGKYTLTFVTDTMAWDLLEGVVELP